MTGDIQGRAAGGESAISPLIFATVQADVLIFSKINGRGGRCRIIGKGSLYGGLGGTGGKTGSKNYRSGDALSIGCGENRAVSAEEVCFIKFLFPI